MKWAKCLFVFLVGSVGCAPELDDRDIEVLEAMAITEQTVLPKSPTNQYADNLQAAQLGRLIFFDKKMSQDGTIACASCHVEQEGWSDKRRVSEGVEKRQGGRHSMPSHTLAYQKFFFWDGRADSAWSQTLQAIESDAEMDFARTQVAHYVARHHRDAYEEVFGPMPSLSGVPERAKPGDAQWQALGEEKQDDVQRIFANVGKALEAYQRRLVCSETRFDQWAKGDVQMTEQEARGAAVFVQQGCTNCHSGVAFSDGEFHNIGVPSLSNSDDGREGGINALLDSPFNAAGRYSDDREYGTTLLKTAMNETRTVNAYKTPSLRGVSQRLRYGHNGGQTSVEAFLDAFYDGNNGRRNNLDPELRGVNVGGNEEEVAVFLKMLDCPPVPRQWQAPE